MVLMHLLKNESVYIIKVNEITITNGSNSYSVNKYNFHVNLYIVMSSKSQYFESKCLIAHIVGWHQFKFEAAVIKGFRDFYRE
jgi:hypothetical protein